MYRIYSWRIKKKWNSGIFTNFDVVLQIVMTINFIEDITNLRIF